MLDLTAIQANDTSRVYSKNQTQCTTTTHEALSAEKRSPVLGESYPLWSSRMRVQIRSRLPHTLSKLYPKMSHIANKESACCRHLLCPVTAYCIGCWDLLFVLFKQTEQAWVSGQ